MNEYRVVWCQMPYNFNTPGVLFIQANDEEQARAFARDHIERTKGLPVSEFSILGCHLVGDRPLGKLLS